MAIVKRQMIIEADSDQVWKALSEFDRISHWSTVVDHSTYLTSSNSGIGCARRIQRGSNTVIETVTEWQSGEVLAYTLSGLPPVFRSATNKWILEANGSQTAVSLTIELLPARPPAALPAVIVSRVIARINRKLLRDLKAYVERRPIKVEIFS